MGKRRKEILYLILLFIIAIIFSLDLFVNRGQPATFDGRTHLTNMAMFYQSIKQGDFPVAWTDGFANYGMPLGLLAQQTTSYLGALFNFIVNDIVLSFNLVVLLGSFLSTFFFYIFLRLYFNPETAFLGAFFFNFAPYRIFNIYIRGALPEFFAAVFIPLILIGSHFLLRQKNLTGFFIIVFSAAFLILTHPFIFVIGGFVFIPFIILNLINSKEKIKMSFIIFLSFVLAIGISSYYFLPLSYERKYFYYGLAKTHLAANHFLNWKNYLIENWPYFYKGDIFTRGHLPIAGFWETLILIVGFTILLIRFFKNSLKINSLLFYSTVSCLLTIFLSTKWAAPVYQKINLLSEIQHPWRLLSAFIFFPPIILACLNEKINKKIFFYLIIIVICFTRFPQLYGKNYTFYPESYYFFTKENLHGNILNTVWTGPTEDYPVKNKKGEIIEGKGKILKSFIKNSERKYSVTAKDRVRMADYTFYFPGWHVFVDGKETEIQFQDPAYRGVITYYLPPGQHQVLVKFTDTKIRLLGKIITSTSLLIFFLVFIFKKKLKYGFKK